MLGPPTLARIDHWIVPQESLYSEFLVRYGELTEAECQRLIAFGSVFCNKKRIHGDALAKPGDYLRVHREPRRFPIDFDWRARVVYEHEDFLILNKPPGIPTHATIDNGRENTVIQAGLALGFPLWVTQRLDVGTQGLIFFAKSPKSQTRFNHLLQDRRVVKKYRALVENTPTPGKLTHYMKKEDRAPKILLPEPTPDAWLCELTIETVENRGRLSEVFLELHTGRSHQIRVQLAQIGCPLAGDTLYGASTVQPIALQAAYLQFCWNDTTPLTFQLANFTP